MTDLEAIKQYRAAGLFWEFLYSRPLPWIFERDPAIAAKIRERDRQRMAKAERVMRQAEKALNQLPRHEWKAAMINRYLLRRDHLATAEVMNYSETSVRRFEQAAIDHLKARERLKAQKAAESPANRF